jgi:hypothetical protein
VVVGDEATIRPELEALGMPIKKLDESGNLVEDSGGGEGDFNTEVF